MSLQMQEPENNMQNPESNMEFYESYGRYDSTYNRQQDISFKEFYNYYCTPKIRKNINAAAIILYCCSALTFVLSFVASIMGVGIMASALDAILVLGLGLGIHIRKSRVCAVIVLIYAIFNCLYSFATTGRPSGYLIIIAGGMAVQYTFMAYKEYKEYIGG